MRNWVEFATRWRAPVVVIWLVLTVAGIIASVPLNGRLTTSLEVPVSQSARADSLLATGFHENNEGTFTIFYRYRSATPVEIEEYKGRVQEAVSMIPTAKILQTRTVAGVLFESVGTNFDLPHAAQYTEPLREALISAGLSGAMVTGPPAIKSDVTPILIKDLHHGEFISLILALLILFFILGFNFSILVPIIFAASVISTSLGAIYLLSHKMLMVLYIPNIVELIGLGLAIDYSLLILQRFRREAFSNSDSAIVTTMASAGRTIMYSATTVALGLAALFLAPIPFLRSLGTAGIIVPLVAILATVTLQPALLSYVGKDNIHPIAPRVNIFATLTRFIIKRPLKVFLTTLLALAIASLPLLALRVTPSSLSAIPHSLESERALELVTKSAGSGSITPSEVLIDLGSANQAVQQNVARERLVAEISNNPEVFLVATGSKDPYVDPTGRYMRIYIIGKHDLGAPQTQRFIRDLRHQLSHSTIFPPDTKIYLGGAPAQGVDLLKRIAASSIWIIALILLVTYLLLYRVFQSAVLPLKAIALDVISISVAIASIVGLMRFENYHLTSIEAWVLIFLFAMLFGLSMDYEVFIVSRIKEARDSGASDSDAIIDGMSETGGVVTAAASIFIIAVGGLVFGHFAGLQELGIGLVAGVLIDATIIRLFLLPSAMVLLGKWNWWRW